MLYDTGVQPFEDGHKLEPHARPKKAGIAVGGIGGVRNAVTPHVSLDVGPPRAKHGANPVAVEGWKDAQVPRARAPKNAHEHRLGAVFGVMSRRDPLRSSPSGRRSQGVPPCAASARLQVASRSNDELRPVERHLERTREALRKVQLSRGRASEAMVDPVGEQPEG